MRFLLIAFLLVAGLSAARSSIAAEPVCGPPEKPASAVTANARVSIKQTDPACKKLGLDLAAEGNPSIRLVMELAYASRQKRGGDRLKPEAPPGMPSGSVLAINGQVDLDASAAAPEGLVSMDVAGPGLNLRAQPIPSDGIVHLPAAQLRPGGDYKWVMRTKRQTYDGTFVFADTETVKRIGDRIRTIPSLDVSPSTALLLEAAIYDDEGFYSARDQTVEKLKTQK